MSPFLEQVARHCFAAGGVEDLCFIFPNRRALVFFRKYLGECVARDGRPLRVPALYTMNDFFYRVSGARQTDQVHLLLELYDCYKELNPKAESLDDFIFWGGVLLSDFDDVDKYLVDPERLFTNIADFRGMQDDFSWLDGKQEAAIRQFLSHFSTGGRYKEEFRRIWDILLPLYRNFNARLREKGMAYEGQVYRTLAERLGGESVADLLPDAFGGVRKFVFVGLNALNECERRLMRRLRDARLAEFCWDYGPGWISDPANKSSLFLSQNVLEFPQAFEPDPEGLGEPEIHVLSVPSGVGQAKQIPAILDKMDAVGIETAVVLPDESLLLPVLNSIPERISDVNVTMGYPLSGSSLSSLMDDVAALQLHLREKDGEWYFYHRYVWSVFSNSLFKTVSGEDGREKAAKIRGKARYYIAASELSGLPVFDCIFRPVVKDPGASDPETVRALEAYQRDLLAFLGSSLREEPGMELELDFIREYYLAVGRLAGCELPVKAASYFRLLEQLVAGTTVPFRGEPLKGLQVMGPLETRALDFRNLIILSCNEGMFPRRSVASSFIPAELRKGFDLPTYEYQDAVWAYYFYRMIRRSERVWLLLDSRTDGLRGGEESRFIKQLELHFGARLTRCVLKAPISRAEEADSIPKTEEQLEGLRRHNLSASSLENYLFCPAKFYYGKVCGLRDEEEVSESLEANDIGNVFHKAMQELYTVPDKFVSRDLLKSALKGNRIPDLVRGLILDRLHCFELAGRNIVFADMIVRYVRKAVQRDIEYLEKENAEGFHIIDLEMERFSRLGGFRFRGVLDRVDSIRPGQLRVLDYKTGKVTDADFIITEGNAEEVVAALFGTENSKRPKIALQLYLYDRLVSEIPEYRGWTVENTVYQPSRLFVREVENVSLNERFMELMEGQLERLLAEIANPEEPWRRTPDRKTCEWCDFKNICGR
jgi:hypothetical protein